MKRVGVILGTVIVAADFLSGTAFAGELVAVKPGVMCASSEALARLTLPNGDSRTHEAATRPDELSAAASGGCIDITVGARVQVQQAFRNTSRVIYAGPGAPADGLMTVPNVDFRAAGDVAATDVSVPAGYAIAQRLAAGGSLTLVLLQDSRITPAIREAMEPTGGDPDEAFQDKPRLRAEFNASPLRNGQLLLQSSDGQVTGRTQLERPFASIKPAPLHGLPTPMFLFEVNYSNGIGGYSGPADQLLAPVQQGLEPLKAVADQGGRSEAMTFPSTLHALWRIVPARAGGTEEIQQATCPTDANGNGMLHLRTYRFRDGRWTYASRTRGECGQLEIFPDRRLFP